MTRVRKEFMVGENSFHLDEENILHITIKGEHDDDTARNIQGAMTELLDHAGRPVDIIADNNKGDKNSPTARKIYKKLAAHEKIGRIAVFGMHPVARVTAQFVIRAMPHDRVRFFRTEEKAMKWLREGK